MPVDSRAAAAPAAPRPAVNPCCPVPSLGPSRARQRRSAESLESVGTTHPAGAHAARGERHRKRGTLASAQDPAALRSRGSEPAPPPGPEGLTPARPVLWRGSEYWRRPARVRCGDPSGWTVYPRARDPLAPVNPAGSGEPRGRRAARAGSHFLRATGSPAPGRSRPGAAPALPRKAVLESEPRDDATDLGRLMAAHPGPSRRAPPPRPPGARSARSGPHAASPTAPPSEGAARPRSRG